MNRRDSDSKGNPLSPSRSGEGSMVTTIITPPKGITGINLRGIWNFRDLLVLLIWRDITIRYKQTIIGASWAVLQPFLTMVVFSIFFGRFANIPSDGLPYPIFSYAGLLPWTFFAGGMKRASDSLVGNSSLISKVHFPRVILPISSVAAGLVDFAVAFVVLLGMMLYYQIPISLDVLWLPLFLLVAFITALGAGLWLSALNVKYRDIRYMMAFLTQLWLYATPVIYPVTLLRGTWKLLVSLNPMTGVVEGSRWAVLGSGVAPSGIFWASVALSLLMLATGLVVFHRMERSFADIV